MSPADSQACGECGGDLPPMARFCPACGAVTIAPSCASCSVELTVGARFCASCGAPVSTVANRSGSAIRTPGDFGEQVAERRVTSVLFGDLVSFTTLSENRDPEDVRELLSHYFTVCQTVLSRYGGTVEKFIGDAVMAVWGVPVAQEDDAERAVRAGLELVESISLLGDEVGAAGLAMRVGVVTGEVAVTLGTKAEGMVAGDAVNTASRVQSIAEPGRVWVDDSTRMLTQAAITYRSTGEHALKGKREPIPLFEAQAVVAVVGGGHRVDGLEAPLIGRDRELRLVKELFHATQETARPRLVVIDGEPGIGKSRLAWEFEKYIDGLSTNVRWLRGRCLSYGDGVAFWALAEALRSRFGLVEGDTGQKAADHLDRSLEDFVSDEDERSWLRPRLATLVGAAEVEGHFAREDLFAAWATFLERMSDGGESVVLVIDDAQHADTGLLDFLDHLLSTAHGAIFVLALARPELLTRRHDLGGRRTMVVHLEPLDEREMTSLVGGLVSELPESTKKSLVGRAEGIPLFAVETVRALIDKAVIVPRGGRYVPAGGVELDLDAIGAPASLHALVAARLDALLPEERRIVCEASVLGLSFPREALTAFGHDAELVDRELASLQRKEIFSIQQDRFSGELGQYRFVQGVVRQVAYSTQSKRDRKLRHLAVAERLGQSLGANDELTTVVAQHLLDAIDACGEADSDLPEITERAVKFLVKGAKRASSLGAPDDALRQYETALVHTVDPVAAAHLQLDAARAANDCSKFARSVELSEAASLVLREHGLSLDAGIATGIQGQALVGMSENSRALAIVLPELAALENLPKSDPALLVLTFAAELAYGRLGDFESMVEYTDRRLVLAEAARDYQELARCHIVLGNRYSAVGAPATAKAMFESAAAIAREHSLRVLSVALLSLATIHISRDLPAALKVAKESYDSARRVGVTTLVGFALINYWLALWTSGQLEQAKALLEEGRELSMDPSIVAALTAVEAWLALATGEPLPGHATPAASDSESELAWNGNLQITLAIAEGDAKGAAAAAAASFPHLLAAGGLNDDFMHLWPPMVLAALSAADFSLAKELLEPVSAAPGVVAPAVRAQFHRLRGLFGAKSGRDPKEVENDLRKGVTLLDEFGAVIATAQARAELGQWLTEQGRGDEGAPLIARSQDNYREIGALGLLSDVDVRSQSMSRPESASDR